jgi:DNA-binding NarL/FixJ family response regulator
MNPALRKRKTSANAKTLSKLLGQIRTLRAQLTKANATIDRLSRRNRSQIFNSAAAEEMARKLDSLSAQERNIARLFLEYPCDKKVARLLGTKPQTVRNQISSIERKLGVASREELIICLLTVCLRSAEHG